MSEQHHKCPACFAPDIGAGFLLCRECWRHVGEELQRAVYLAWKAFRTSAGIATREAWLSAAAQATDAARKARFPELTQEGANDG